MRKYCSSFRIVFLLGCTFRTFITDAWTVGGLQKAAEPVDEADSDDDEETGGGPDPDDVDPDLSELSDIVRRDSFWVARLTIRPVIVNAIAAALGSWGREC